MGALPYYDQTPSSRQNSRGHTWRLLLLGSFIVISFYFQPWPLSRWLANNQQTWCNDGICAQPNPPANRSTYSDAYESSEFKKKSALRLSGAVKIPTMFVQATALSDHVKTYSNNLGPSTTWDLYMKMSAGSHFLSSIDISRLHFRLCMGYLFVVFISLIQFTGRQAHATREVVGGYSLVYTLQGSSPDLKPFMLMAHIDVVPA
jgi:hypothetical protein